MPVTAQRARRCAHDVAHLLALVGHADVLLARVVAAARGGGGRGARVRGALVPVNVHKAPHHLARAAQRREVARGGVQGLELRLCLHTDVARGVCWRPPTTREA